MNQVMITIVAGLAPSDIPAARAAIDRLGNPAAPALAARLDVLSGDAGIHFMSVHALPSFTRGRGHLVLEFSADGDAPRAINQIVAACGAELASVFALATDWRDGDMVAYLTSHTIEIGFGLGANPGLCHCGSPDMSVGRIRREAALAARISEMLARQPGGMSALSRVEDVRRQIGAASPDLAPGEGKPAFSVMSLPAAAFVAVFAFAKTYLWPFGLLLLVWSLACGAYAGMAAHSWLVGLKGVWLGFWAGLPVLASVLIALAIGLYLWLRKLETTDWMSTRAPERGTLHQMIARENLSAQNHMVSLTELKAGWLRRFTVRLAFFVIATVGPRLYKPGYLGPIGTIHFARWVTLPGTRDFIFFSNYGGSWEAYLEDFITLAHLGLTGVWSNTVGFPKTNNLAFDGATDGERFKRYARQSMTPTRFWYSAYPELTTDMIRANSGIRRGLSGAMTEDDAQAWLCYFGSALRPDDRLVTSEIQSLLFGGLGFLNYSALTLWKMPGDAGRAAAWLKEVSRHIAYNDGRRLLEDDAVDAVVQVAISAAGLKALGLPDEGLETFPPAFLDDMTTAYRARILGDSGPNSLEYWWWGQEPSDVAVIVYGQTEEAFRQLKAELNAIATRHEARLLHTVDMKTYDRDDNHEPFGFADGGSQPVIRGTYKGLRSGDPMHLVEPGEFILGYPDNRGNLPPVPNLPAIYDPENVLPVLGGSTDFSLNSVNNPRDLGFNGSYLVIRQLEQDPEAFDGYLKSEAARLKTSPGATVSDRRGLSRRQADGPLAQRRAAGAVALQPISLGRHHRRQQLRAWVRGPRRSAVSVRGPHPPRQPARQPQSRLDRSDRHQQSPPHHAYRPQVRPGTGPEARPAVHVPQWRSGTAIRVHSADLGAGKRRLPELPDHLERRARSGAGRRPAEQRLHHSHAGWSGEAEPDADFRDDPRRRLLLPAGKAPDRLSRRRRSGRLSGGGEAALLGVLLADQDVAGDALAADDGLGEFDIHGGDVDAHRREGAARIAGDQARADLPIEGDGDGRGVIDHRIGGRRAGIAQNRAADELAVDLQIAEADRSLGEALAAAIDQAEVRLGHHLTGGDVEERLGAGPDGRRRRRIEVEADIGAGDGGVALGTARIDEDAAGRGMGGEAVGVGEDGHRRKLGGDGDSLSDLGHGLDVVVFAGGLAVHLGDGAELAGDASRDEVGLDPHRGALRAAGGREHGGRGKGEKAAAEARETKTHGRAHERLPLKNV